MLEPDTHLCIEEPKTCLKMDAKKIYFTLLIFFLNHVINSVVEIFIIKHNLCCLLPADFFILEEGDLSFSNTL